MVDGDVGVVAWENVVGCAAAGVSSGPAGAAHPAARRTTVVNKPPASRVDEGRSAKWRWPWSCRRCIVRISPSVRPARCWRATGRHGSRVQDASCGRPPDRLLRASPGGRSGTAIRRRRLDCARCGQAGLRNRGGVCAPPRPPGTPRDDLTELLTSVDGAPISVRTAHGDGSSLPHGNDRQ